MTDAERPYCVVMYGEQSEDDDIILGPFASETLAQQFVEDLESLTRDRLNLTVKPLVAPREVRVNG